MKFLTRMAGYIDLEDIVFAIPIALLVSGMIALVMAPTKSVDPLLVEIQSVNFCEKQKGSDKSRCGVLVLTSRPDELRALDSFRLPDPESSPDSEKATQ